MVQGINFLSLSSLDESADVMEFEATDAYSNLGRTKQKGYEEWRKKR
jgi:hypothetical protein